MAKFEQALDDIVAQNKKSRGNSTFGRKRGSPNGGRFNGRAGSSTVYKRRATNLVSRSRSNSLGNRDRELPCRMSIRNLDYKVDEKDLYELFGELGGLKKAVLHYDRNGKSLGSGELTFTTRGGGFRAKKKYGGVPLDNRPMEIDFVGERPEPKVSYSKPSFSPRGRGGFRGGRGRGGRFGREEKNTPTAEELDKELDKYLVSGAK